jgi:hypothetical protein
VTSGRPEHPRGVRIPRVNPIGLVEEPDDYVTSPRVHPAPVRVAAALLLAVFLAVVCATTVASLGAYCLTTDTANVSRLPRH